MKNRYKSIVSIAALIVLGGPAWAASSPDVSAAEPAARRERLSGERRGPQAGRGGLPGIAQLGRELGLTEEQKAAIAALAARNAPADRGAGRVGPGPGRGRGNPPSAEAAGRGRRGGPPPAAEARDGLRAEIRALLTPEQQVKFDAMARPAGRGGPGRDGAPPARGGGRGRPARNA